MSRAGSSIVQREIDAVFRVGALGTLTDGQLLEMFKDRRDAGAGYAFAVLIERHGPMVLGVCRRILRDPHDAADAFQATFLVLVRKANAVRASDSLGRWLYGVSRRVALQARADAVRRSAREVAGEEPAAVPSRDSDRCELLSALEEAVARLPGKYRAVVLLCDLGGLTHEAAARQLDCPVGTVESRLFRARRLLRARLTRLGLAPAALVAVLSSRSATAGVPEALKGATTAAAVGLSSRDAAAAGKISAAVETLMKGALRAMFWDRLKIGASLLLSVGIVTAGAGVLVGQERADPGSAPPARSGPVPVSEGRPGDRAGFRARDRATMASLERRLQELERKLDAVLALTPDGTRGGGPPIAQPGRIDPDTIRRIRPRFECLVEKVVVKAGQAVKKGDPLAELFSPELAAAKNDLLARTLQWDHDKRLLDLRKKLVETGAIGSQLWTDTQNDEARSRLEAAVARDHLRLYGLGEREIDAVKDEDGEKKARFTLRAPEDGTVIEVVAAPDDLAGPKGVLLVIAGSKR